jgi:hypothetical protein
VTVLEDWNIAEEPLHAVYPDNRLIGLKVKKFVFFLAGVLCSDGIRKRSDIEDADCQGRRMAS